jgi:hypothetical protein
MRATFKCPCDDVERIGVTVMRLGGASNNRYPSYPVTVIVKDLSIRAEIPDASNAYLPHLCPVSLDDPRCAPFLKPCVLS